MGTTRSDILIAEISKTTLYGLEGDDLITGVPDKRNVLFGNEGNDRITGGDRRDVLNGGADQDNLIGRSGNDHLVGGAGDDLMQGGKRKDRLDGESGHDRLRGEAGNDQLNGGTGSDSLSGGQGVDRLIDQDGGDRLIGGQGADRFEVGSPTSTKASIITDFAVGSDQIKVLRLGATFDGLTFDDYQNGVKLLDQGRVIAVLLGVSAADLSSDSFVFGSADLATDLQASIQQSTQGTQIPGTSAAVITSDGSIWTGTAGVSNLDTEKPVSDSDRFNVGSITKAIVATTVLQLVEEGELSLNGTLDQYIPVIADQLPNGDQITIRQLLNHTSGLPDVDNIIREQTINDINFQDKIIHDPKIPRSVRNLFRSLRGDYISYEAIVSDPSITRLNSTNFNYLAKTLTANSSFARRRTTSDELIELAYEQPSLSKPGKDYQYNNINYLLLGKIVETVTDSTLAQQMRQRIFKPLGMTNTVYPPEERRKGYFARGYEDFDKDGKADDVLNYIDQSQFGFANGGIYSTASDLARFTQGLFGGELLAPSTLNKMLSNGNQDDENFKYGLGMLYGRVPGVGKVWQHGGDNDGWHARMYYLPDQDTTVVVVQNGDDISQRRSDGNPASPTLLIDDLTNQMAQRAGN